MNKIKQSAGSAAVRGGRIDKKFGKGHIVLAIILFGAWLWYGANIDAVRYRLTLEIETPQGLRSASSVIQNFYEEGFVPGRGRLTNTDVTGEAVYVDLGGGRHVIALLDGQVFNDFVDRRGDVSLPLILGTFSPQRASRELSARSMPTLVTFTDIANPASAKVVKGINYRQQCREDRKPACVSESIAIPFDEIAATFGQGYAFKRATVSFVNPGFKLFHVWPFSWIPLNWPQWLFGAPVTRGIDARLPWIGDYPKETIFERRLRETNGESGSLMPGRNLKRGL